MEHKREWTNLSAVRFIDACLKDKGMPRFRVPPETDKNLPEKKKSISELEKKYGHKLTMGRSLTPRKEKATTMTAYCWGGINKFNDTIHYSNVPEEIINLITDNKKPDWPQIAEKINSPSLLAQSKHSWKLLYEALQ